VAITVQPVNDAPVALPQTLYTDADASVVVHLKATDVEGDPLAFVIDAPPQHGAVTGVAPDLTYSPAAGFVGGDALSFHATDGTDASNVAQVIIIVDQPADAGQPDAGTDDAGTPAASVQLGPTAPTDCVCSTPDVGATAFGWLLLALLFLRRAPLHR